MQHANLCLNYRGCSNTYTPMLVHPQFPRALCLFNDYTDEHFHKIKSLSEQTRRRFPFTSIYYTGERTEPQTAQLKRTLYDTTPAIIIIHNDVCSVCKLLVRSMF